METLPILSFIVVVFCVNIAATNTGNDDVMIQMLARIETLEKKDHDQSLKLAEQAAHIANIESNLENQVTANKQMQDRIHKLEKHEAEQIQATGALKQEMYNIRQPSHSRVQPLKHKPQMASNTTVAGNATKQKRLVLDDYEGPIAFQARIMKGEVGHIGLHQKFVFDDVLTNLGSGYHNLHGIFIAPSGGIYIFSASILSFTTAHSEFYASIMKNGVVIARVYGHGDTGRHDQGSATIVTPLVTGDEVWVELYGPAADDSIWGDGFTSFMGCLLTPQ